MSTDVSNTLDDIDRMRDVPVTVEACLDDRLMEMLAITELVPGVVVALQKAAGETLDVYVDNVRMASAEVVVIEDTLALRITAIEGFEA